MRPIVRMIFGSHIYGTNTPESDTDYKQISIPEVDSIVLQEAFKVIKKSTGDDKSKNTKEDIDDENFSVHHFLKQLLEGQTYCLDMLFTPEKFYTQKPTRAWHVIRENRHRLVHKGIASFAGYCQTQAGKYSMKGSNLAAFRLARDFFLRQEGHSKVEWVIDKFKEEVLKVAAADTMYHDKEEPIIRIVNIPHKNHGGDEFFIQVGHKTKVPLTASCKLAAQIWGDQFDKYGERAKLAETNQGVDFKALSHAVRVCREAEELLLTGSITFPLKDPIVKEIKLEKHPFGYVSEVIEEGLERVYAAQEISSLPAKPDYLFARSLVKEIYAHAVVEKYAEQFGYFKRDT